MIYFVGLYSLFFHNLKCLSLGTSSFKLHKSICFAQMDFFHE